jgi:hypothetical protein
MTDVTSGWFALGGALIGATGTQVTTIINTYRDCHQTARSG